MAILGIGMFAYALFNSATILLFIGCGLIIASVIQLANCCWARAWKGFSFGVLLGMIYLIIGFLLMEHRQYTSVAFTLVVAAGLLIAGSVKVILSMTEQWEGWKLSLVSGILTSILGICIWLEWPVQGFWVLGCCVGLELTLNGFTWMEFGASLHQWKPPQQPSANS